MVARRSLGHWRMLAALVCGVVMAAALMSSVFLYSDAIRDLGLSHALDTQRPLSLDLFVHSPNSKALPADYDARRDTVDQLLRAYGGDITRQTVRMGTSASFFVTPPGGTLPDDNSQPRAQLQFQDGLAEHTKLVAGRMPIEGAPAMPGAPPTIEVLLGKDTADALGTKLGDTFDLHPYWQEDVAPVVATVVGFIVPNDINEEYWGGDTSRFTLDTANWKTYPFFLSESTILKSVGGYLPDMDMRTDTLAMVDPGRINAGNTEDVQQRATALGQQVVRQVEGARLETKLPDTIANYRDKLYFTRLPLFAVMIQVVGIVLFYLVMVASMVVERQTGEVALLKSRGASTGQVVIVFAIEAAAICLAAIVLGPLLATGAIALLGLTPPFHGLSGGHLLHVPLSGGAVGLAAFGALLAFGALIWPAYRACRFSITHYKQEISRPPRQPAFLRYYLDLVVAGAAALAFYQLRHAGGLSSTGLFDDKTTDPVLLATPTLLILLVALVFLRVFPLVLSVVAWLTRQLRGATISFALTRMVRSPIQHSRLILLLILTTSVGVFAAGFRATLERGYEARAAYQAGSEVRIQDVRKPYATTLAPFNDVVTQATGSTDFTTAARVNGSVSTGTFRSADLSVLAVDSSRFASFAYWRGDFAGSSLADLVKKLPLSPPGLPAAVVVEPGSRFIGLWAQVPLSPSVYTLGLRLKSADGVEWEYRLQPEKPAVNGQWTFFAADLARPVSGRAGGVDLPRTVDTVFLRATGQQPTVPEQIAIGFDDLQVTKAQSLGSGWGATGLPGAQVVEPFDDIGRYELVTGVSSVANPGQFARTDLTGRPGTGARLAYTRGPGGPTVVGLRPQSDQRPVPVVVDSKFLDETKSHTGDELSIFINSQFVRVKVVGTFDLFPGFDPEKPTHLLLADYTAFLAAATRAPAGYDSVYPNEVWMGDQGGGLLTKESLTAKGLAAETVIDRQVVLAAQSDDPLIAASWQGILFLAFAAVLLLSALGFITHSGLSAQARSLEFAILRTMGMSGRQIIGVVTFEQVFVVVAGVAAGTFLGYPLSRLMIDAMGINEQGGSALPPLLPSISLAAILTVYTSLAIVVGVTVGALVLLYSRLAVSRALRMGEL
jgi:ABC-type lipoprotein release transport system permease subunit